MLRALSVLPREPRAPFSKRNEDRRCSLCGLPLAKESAIRLEEGIYCCDNCASIRQVVSNFDVRLRTAYLETIHALASAVEARDPYTGGHVNRVTRMACALGEPVHLSPHQIECLERGAILHDIGKIGVPDAILRKPGPLDAAEWEWVKRHPRIAFEILQPIEFLHESLDCILHHHERWDGKGYPDGLRGEAIPMEARVMTVADALDAMTSTRPYRSARSFDEALAEIIAQAGAQFDPRVTRVLPDFETKLRRLVES